MEDPAEENGPITVTFDAIRWEVDFGGGITQRFAHRQDAVAAARFAAAAEGRELDIEP